MRHLHARTAIAAVAILFAATACSSSGSSSPATSPTTSSVPSPSSTSPTTATAPTTAPSTSAAVPPTTGPSATSTLPAATTTLRIWFVNGDRLAPAYRSGATIDDALRSLVAGPTTTDVGLTSQIPTGTELRSVTVDASTGTAIVDLSGRFATGGGSLSMTARLAEVVFTATEFDGVRAVLLHLDGQAVQTLGGEGLIVSDPLDRSGFDNVKPFLLVDEPRPGAVLTSPFRVSGTNSTIENTVQITLEAADGRVLVSTYTTGTGPIRDQEGQPVWGPYVASVAFDRAGATEGTLKVFESSTEDGSARFVLAVPVRFDTSGGVPGLPGALTTEVSVPDTPGGPGLTAQLTAVRTAQHVGYERVVFEFANVVPGYSVRYVDRPITADPSGLPVTVSGESVLLVHLAMASGVDLTSNPVVTTYTGPKALVTGYPAISGLTEVGDFEAVLTWAIGVMTRPPFTVSTLTAPPRVVIDIASAGM